jgi:hypothetical protein
MRSAKPYIIGVILLILFAFGYVVYSVKRFTEIDWCYDHGYGLTTLRGRVIDTLTGKPIDSVGISIVSGHFWDHYLDTIVKQNDTLVFTFNTLDCEPYFYTIDTKYYWIDFDNHPAYKFGVDKGVVNNFEIYLKPATFLKMSVERDTLASSDDQVILQIRKGDTGTWEELAYISRPDFKEQYVDYMRPPYDFSDSCTIRTLSKCYSFESTIAYDVRWISHDTILYHVAAEPFDTVKIDYAFNEH